MQHQFSLQGNTSTWDKLKTKILNKALLSPHFALAGMSYAERLTPTTAKKLK